jgi:hypothetical protein
MTDPITVRLFGETREFFETERFLNAYGEKVTWYACGRDQRDADLDSYGTSPRLCHLAGSGWAFEFGNLYGDHAEAIEEAASGLESKLMPLGRLLAPLVADERISDLQRELAAANSEILRLEKRLWDMPGGALATMLEKTDE